MIRNVLRSLRGPLKCLLPHCYISVRASAGSVLLSIDLIIDQNGPDDPNFTVAVARAAAIALVATNVTELSSIVNVTVLANWRDYDDWSLRADRGRAAAAIAAAKSTIPARHCLHRRVHRIPFLQLRRRVRRRWSRQGVFVLCVRH